MLSNQNLQTNGASITNMTVSPVTGANIVKAQQGYFDSSIMLESIIKLDPMKNMIMLQTAWDKQVMKRSAFSSSILKKVVNNNQILEVNGQDGGFKYKMAVETDNCMRTVEDTSSQSADGYLGADGTTFKIVLNRKLSPNQTLSSDKAFGKYLLVQDQEVEALAHGYVHYVSLLGSEQDKFMVYQASLLQADVVYTVTSDSAISEYTEKLGIPHLPTSTNYIESEFKLGSGYGAEHWFTGKADSYKLQSGYTTADTQKYLSELANVGLDKANLAMIKVEQANGKQIAAASDLLEILTLRSFTDRFNSSLMFMQGAKISNGNKGVLEFNEGLWQQMRRGKIFTYNRKGGIEISDLVSVRNYVYLNNDSPVDESFLNIEAGTELYENVSRIIEQQALKQLNNLSALQGSPRVTPSPMVTGRLTELEVALVKFTKAHVPGIGMLAVTEDKTLNYLGEGTDIRNRGVNPRGYDHTTYSGYVWDVTDQFYSNNAVLPDGTRAVGGENVAKHNTYLVRPEKNIYWGRTTGRYSSAKASDIAASNNLMGEGFFIYGFGAMWMPDPSKFVMIELKNRHAGIR